MPRVFVMLLALVLALWNCTGRARTMVEYRTSKVHALVVFAETISGMPFRSETLRANFEASPWNNKEARSLIERIRSCTSSYWQHWDYPNFPPQRHNGGTIRDQVLIQSTFARDQDDFQERLIGLMPVADVAEFIGTLKELEPIYDASVWKPNQEKLEATRKLFSTKALEWHLQEMFDHAERFYHASWPSGLPFVIALFPIPGEKGTANSEQLAAVESVGILVDNKNYVGKFGVIFHEMCHSLYQAQSAEFQKNLENMFYDSQSPYRFLANAYLNEALATALGNGWAAEKAGGYIHRKWYDDPYIDGYAKAIFPAVKTYVESDRSIDQAFILKAIRTFGSTFPDSIRSPETLMKKILLIFDNTAFKATEITEAIRAHFRTGSIDLAPGLLAPLTSQKHKDSHDTAVIIVSDRNKSQLGKIAESFESLKPYQQQLIQKQDDYVLARPIGNRPAVVVIKVKDSNRIIAAFKALSALKVIDDKSPFVKID